jgi:SSS family solute:Na+ symporter
VQDVNWTALIIFIALFGFITWLGFAAAHWRKGDLDQLNEWGLGGRRFGTLITWFLVGGDLYTAYTFIAVPALAFGAGAIAFFAVPYTIMIYPILFLVFPRLWYVCHKHNYITPADFVRGRFGNRWLALAVTITGIVATMPYIALQLVGLQVVIGAMGVGGPNGTLAADLPLIVAFIVLAAFTYSSGLRAPASIAIVKDILIYITAFAAVIVVPIQLGGFGNIFAKIPPAKLLLAVPGANTTGSYGIYATLALGSALALFLYPHSITGILAASSGKAVRRNAALLPGYSFMLGLLALVGFFALAAGLNTEFAAGFKQFGNNFAVPALYLHSFPSWFVGIAFAAIGIGALVPAAIMSIAAANLYTRNIHREFINRNPTDKQEAQMAKWVSLIVKFGALLFILFVPTQYAIFLQLLGGILIIQTLPSVMLGVYTRWFNDWALLIGWAVGTAVGIWMFNAANWTPNYALSIGGHTFPGYAALYTVILNLVIAIVLTPIFNAMGGKQVDETVAADYHA